ncbi:membrane progestin receptor gamma isoform X2 [Vidua chalybeata]|uniref:membrane progestin receptor gamma isoform X2 n=1 Tax=Vidua chalybeata TaxID=81927 RepID=UPI0023A85D48|nr:membrane progestin receptor gamma isoform X2 [Vidua chalybeata]
MDAPHPLGIQFPLGVGIWGLGWDPAPHPRNSHPLQAVLILGIAAGAVPFPRDAAGRALRRHPKGSRAGKGPDPEPAMPSPTARLLRAHQSYREPGILSGYRPPRSSACECLLSLFAMNNETLNIWTHLVPAGLGAGVFRLRLPAGMGREHIPQFLRSRGRAQLRAQHWPVLLFQVSGGGAAQPEQSFPNFGLRVSLHFRQHPSFLQAVPERGRELLRRLAPAAFPAQPLRPPDLPELHLAPARAPGAGELRLHRAQPPGFPHLRDPGNALPAGSRLRGHGGAARPPPASLFPGNLRIPGNGSGRQPGHPRGLLPQPLPGASFPGKIPLESWIAWDFWEQSHSRGVPMGELDRLEIFLWEFPKGKLHRFYPRMGWETLPIPLLSTGKASNNRDLIPEEGGKRSCFPKNPASLRSATGRNPGNVGIASWEIPGGAKHS